MYSYVVTSQKPTAVKHAVVCSFTGPTDKNLILGRGTNLEIRTWQGENLVSELEVSLCGKIASIVSYRPHGAITDVLFILTEHKHFCVLAFDPVGRKVITKATGNSRDRVGRDLDAGMRTIVDPESRYICMLIYEGLLKVTKSSLNVITLFI